MRQVCMTGVLVLLVVVSACQFYKPSALATVEPQEHQQSDQPHFGPISVTFQWENQTTPMIRMIANLKKATEKSWIDEKVITLPVQMPETIDLIVQFKDSPDSMKDLSVTAVATTGDDLNEKKLGVELIESTPEGAGTVVKAQLSGLNVLFSDDKEQRAYATITFKKGSAQVAKLVFFLSTPPSRLSLIESEFVLNRRARDESSIRSFRVLSSQAQSRELIERVQFRNDSFEQMRLSVPFRTHARVQMRGIRHKVESAASVDPYFHPVREKKEEEIRDFEGDFFIFPLNQDLPHQWTGYTQKDLESIFVQPGELVELGLYADSRVIAEIKKYPSSQPSTETMVSDGIAHCKPEARSELPPSGSESQYCDFFIEGSSHWLIFPAETIALCKEAMRGYRACLDSGFRDVALCNQVALFDYELDQRKKQVPNRSIYLPIWISCQKTPLNSDGITHRREPAWSWEPVFGEFLIGLETKPVVANWNNEEESLIPIYLRFSSEQVKENTETRRLMLFESKKVLREH